ncbi:MAG: hypothetical protein AB7P23_10505 [Amphiplicatus sp.]
MLARLWMVGAAMLAPAFAQDQVNEAPMTQAPPAAEPPADINPDESASWLNAQQKLKQTYTITRTINGEIVETQKRTIIYDPADPTRPTEAGSSPLEELKAAFDREALTRTEAYEEAKLDFITADIDRNNLVNADEFVRLAKSWQDEPRMALASDEETARQRQYRAFVDSLDPQAAAAETEAQARAKFASIAGPPGTLSRDAYIRAYLLDFDMADADKNMILRGDELLAFRAANRGERLATTAE